MRVKCVICDNLNEIPDFSPLAKKLRNRPIHTYMCPACHDRITEKTMARLATGKFRFIRNAVQEEEEF
ncbi:YlaI family protein [Rummeliibacillus sp. SL167]|uniref:YlaI family protein n=1 Tax=Rummeliibacillus sp. SL167 TaxID=2579792 RepID=UPI0011B3B6A2|nr:YlaI family protein [Rummeliibacillus sp. SL167]